MIPPIRPLVKPLQLGAVAACAHMIGLTSLNSPVGANAMRAVLALGMLVALCASADAATVHHSKPRHVIVRHSQSVDPRFPPVLQDQTPSYDDPSKFGGG
jgi:hypothetical protein